MNVHLQLLWKAAFAPTAAVDLARQHPSPYRLGWIYVGILSVWSFICDWFIITVVRPLTGIVVEPSAPGLAWLDSLTGLAVMAVVGYVFIYVVQRWYWRLFADESVDQSSIDAAIVAGSAFSVLLVLPQYFLLEVLQNSVVATLIFGFLVPFGVAVVFYAIYFSHALGMSHFKALWVNILASVLFLFAAIFFIIAALVIYASITGATFNTMFDVAESAP